MTTLTVTAKGQITLRKDVLRHLGVAPGQKIEIDMLPNGRLEMRAANSAGSIEDFFGSLERPGTKPLTIEEINEVIADGWAGVRGGSPPIRMLWCEPLFVTIRNRPPIHPPSCTQIV